MFRRPMRVVASSADMAGSSRRAVGRGHALDNEVSDYYLPRSKSSLTSRSRNASREPPHPLDPRDRLSRAVHGRPRQPDRHGRASLDPHRPRRVPAAARVDRQRLHPRLRRHAHPRRRARRPLRPQADLPRRARALHRVERRRGARARRRRARRRAGAAGRRRRDRRAAHADAARRGVPGRAARRRARHLVRHQRHGHRARPARRRRGRRRPLVAVDLLDQRPARRRPAPARRRLPAREPRRGDPARPPRRRARDGRPVRPRVRPRPRSGRGVGEPAHRREPRLGRAAARRLRRLGAPRAAADAAARPVRRARVRGDERRVVLHVLRDVRLDLPHHPVRPAGHGLRAVRRRRANAGLDRRDRDHEPDRRRARRAPWPARADGSRPRDAGRRAGVAGDGGGRRPRRTRACGRRS